MLGLWIRQQCPSACVVKNERFLGRWLAFKISASPSPELQAKLEQAGIAEVFEEARKAIIRSDSYSEALQTASEELGEAELGIGDWVTEKLSRLAQPIGTFYVKRRRGAITSSVSPTPCDILLYQGRGDRIRAFIRAKIEQAEPPVVLLAHSLGGIACVD